MSENPKTTLPDVASEISSAVVGTISSGGVAAVEKVERIRELLFGALFGLGVKVLRVLHIHRLFLHRG